MSRCRLIAAAFAMLDAIHRFFILLFGQPQRIDYWLLGADIVIVLLIAWVDIPEKLHKQRVKRRLVVVQSALLEGRNLQYGPPASSAEEAVAIAWVDSVKTWIGQTHQFLGGYSAQAAASFIHDSGSGAGVHYPRISRLAEAQEWYKTLQARLNNLHDIMEKPDVYF